MLHAQEAADVNYIPSAKKIRQWSQNMGGSSKSRNLFVLKDERKYNFRDFFELKLQENVDLSTGEIQAYARGIVGWSTLSPTSKQKLAASSFPLLCSTLHPVWLKGEGSSLHEVSSLHQRKDGSQVQVSRAGYTFCRASLVSESERVSSCAADTTETLCSAGIGHSCFSHLRNQCCELFNEISTERLKQSNLCSLLIKNPVATRVEF